MEQKELLSLFTLISSLSDNDRIHITTAATESSGSRAAEIPVAVFKQYVAKKCEVTIVDGLLHIGGELAVDKETGKPVSIYGKKAYVMTEEEYQAKLAAGALQDAYYLTTEE